MSNIKKAFENGKAFIAFVTCGDPDLETTAKLIKEAVKNGADMIKLGIPFSDPTAEGPAIQAANIRALNGGINITKIFAFLHELRKEVSVPIVFMTYANVVFSYGAERFISYCCDTNIDGLIIPDLPYEEKDEFLPICRKYGVDLISVISSATPERIAMIAKEAGGFIYVVPNKGITATAGGLINTLPEIIDIIRQNTDIPCAVAGGISTPEEAKAIAGISDGAIIGTEIVKIVAKYKKHSPKYVGKFVKSVKNAVIS